MTEPVSLETAKKWCRVEDDDDDDIITALIVAAREWVEDFTGQTLVAGEVTDPFPSFGDLTLKHWPVALDGDGAPTLELTYLDSEGTEQTYEDWRLVSGKRPAVLLPAIGTTWPSAYVAPDAVRVTYAVGYADAAAVPGKMKQAILVLVAHWYSNRDLVGESNDMAISLCRPFRLPVL